MNGVALLSHLYLFFLKNFPSQLTVLSFLSFVILFGIEPVAEPKAEAFRQRVFGGGADGEILQDAFNVDMTRVKMKCLRTRTWLNDEVSVFFFSQLEKYTHHT